MAKTFLLLVASIAALARAGEHVLSLGDSDFDDEMAQIDVTIVKFYAPWCGHCKRMAPEYEKAAKTLKDNDPPIKLVDVDCTEAGKESCSKYGVSGYPTLKVFRNGQLSDDYKGGREAADFVKFLQGQAGPASTECKDVDKFTSVTTGQKHAVVGFFSGSEDAGFVNYMKAANELREKVRFMHTFSEDVMKAADKAAGSITMYRPAVMANKFEPQSVDYGSNKFTIGLVRNWVISSHRGLVPVIAADKQDDLGYPQIICAYAVDYERNAKGTQYWRNRVMKIAQKFEGKHLNFAVGRNEEWGQQIQEAGLTAGDKPQCIAYDDKATKYTMKDEFDLKSFEQFVNDYQGGKMEAHIKSEDSVNEPGTANLELTAKNFKDHVDGTKDTFIKFYAPWCGHCKSIAPKWVEMADEFQGDDNVVIGHFNADANDLPAGFEVKGFPTLYWMPANKAPVKYQGGRETKDLIAYVNENRQKTEL